MSGTTRVSVIMGVHNDEEFIGESVESIINQTYRNFEFIIVEDAPTDRTPDILDQYEDGRVIRIKNDTNLGLTISLNQAFDHASGKYIARQDADDISQSDRLARQISYLDDHPDIACLGTSATLIGEKGGVIGHRRALTRPTLKDFLRKNQVVHGSAMMRRDVLDHLGGYNELFSVAQDYELWLRMIDDWPIHNLEVPLYRLRVHENSIYRTKQVESLLYNHLAKRSKVSGKTKPLRTVRNEGIHHLFGELTATERLAIQKSMAKTLLRYGQSDEGRQVLRQKAVECGLDLTGWLLYGLTYLPDQAIQPIIQYYRRYLNVRTWVQNRRREYDHRTE